MPERVPSHFTLRDEVEEESPQRRTIVELRHFLGLTDGEAAKALGVPLRTVQRDWYQAKRWLLDWLNQQRAWKAVSNATSG